MGRLGDLLRRGASAPFRALLPKNPWLRVLVYALPFVLLLALFHPALDVVLRLVELAFKVVDRLLETMLGRIVLLLLVFTLGGLFAVWLLKSRVRNMRAEAVSCSARSRATAARRRRATRTSSPTATSSSRVFASTAVASKRRSGGFRA
jgi:hypothetical protein